MFYKTTYSKLFPPPKFLEMSFVSVEILPTGISFLTVKNTSQGLLPDISGMIPLPELTISQGEIIKKEPILKALADIRRKTGVNFVRFSIPEEKTYIFKINLPKLQPKEIHDVLNFKIEENVPLAVKDAIFDYDIVPNLRQKQSMELVVYVTPLKFVEEMQSIFESIGLTPVLFSPESNNLARAVVKEKNEQTIVIVNIKESNIIFSLVICGVVCQTSSLSFGSSTFTNLLAKYFNVSFAEALKIKEERLYSDNPDSMEIFSYLINTISAIKDEIYKFISFCDEKEDSSRRVDRIILCGHDAAIVGFDKYLSLNLKLNVEVGNVWTNNFKLDDYVPEINKTDSLDQAVVNGLSLI